MASHATPLLLLPQSKLVGNTARFLQSKIDKEKCGRDWLCSQHLVPSLTQTKFYKSQSHYFRTDNIPPLETEASLLDLSSKGKCSIPVENIEIWEKRARKIMAINSHVDLFSSAAYLCMQQQTMSVPALLRLLEAIAKSIKHAMAMSTILAKEIFQARHDGVLATSKILLDSFNHELRNAPINSKTLFGNKIKEVAKGNFEAQQQRFLATSSVATTVQQQKVTYLAPPVFKRPKQQTKPSRPQQTPPYSPKSQTQSYSSSRKEYAKREVEIRNSSPPLSKPRPPQNSEVQPFPLPVLPRPKIPVGGRLVHFVEQWEEMTDNKWVLCII